MRTLHDIRRQGTLPFVVLSLVAAIGLPALAFDGFALSAPGAPGDLEDDLRDASLVAQAERDGTTDVQNLFAAARADYARLTGTLYAAGYYSGVIHILVDGQEAALIKPLDAPESIKRIDITVEPGPRFTFSRARMKPYARGTKLPSAYGDTKPAYSTAIADAADAGVEGWRNIGHAKARIGSENIVADHASATLDSEVLLEPGPRLRFGRMSISGAKRMRLERIAKIAGFPTGEVFDPDEVDRVAKRLRNTGVFSSVALSEAEVPSADGTLDFDLVLAEEKKRRIGAGAEVSSSEGFSLSAYWMHRNLWGGGEKLRVDAGIKQLSSFGDDLGYNLGVRIDRPATPVTDATAFVTAKTYRTDLVDQMVEANELGFGLTRMFGDHLKAAVGLGYVNSRTTDRYGPVNYNVFALPIALTWDNRDDAVNATKGYYLDGQVTPFYGMGGTGSGAQFKADLRTYRGFGKDDRIVLAGRFQIGTVAGSNLDDTPPEYLFWSGGGGTVRGQPYQSLGVDLVRAPTLTVATGGMSFAGFSGEVRAKITEKFGGVAFYDAGYLTDDALFDGSSDWHAGAGLGLRYFTGIGPIRLDVGLPVSGSTGDGPQLYLGIGQAF